MSGRRKPPKPNQSLRATTAKAPPDEKSGALEQVAELLPGTAPVPERVRQVVQQTTFNGPIPHPDIFKRYGDVIPDAPERILRVFELDSAHARDIQTNALEAQKADNRRVHWMAWSLIAGGYVLAAVFAFLDKDLLAGTILATTLAGTIAGFFQSHKAGPKSDDNNSD